MCIYCCRFLQSDGSSLASGSGFYGRRVAVASKTSVVPMHRNVGAQAVMAPPEPQQRSPASTGAVSHSIQNLKLNLLLANSISQRNVHNFTLFQISVQAGTQTFSIRY